MIGQPHRHPTRLDDELHDDFIRLDDEELIEIKDRKKHALTLEDILIKGKVAQSDAEWPYRKF